MAQTYLTSSERMPVKQAAQYLCLSPSTLNKWRVTGEGPDFLKLGRRVVYDIKSLDSWMAAKARRSTSEYTDATSTQPNSQ